MEISFALTYLSSEQAARMLNNHPANYLLFGSDSPWDDQSSALQRLKQLPLDQKLLHGILGSNAEKLLQLRDRSSIIKSC
jgi:predicted TIM-barrel fold metal-dependent hydrolase